MVICLINEGENSENAQLCFDKSICCIDMFFTLLNAPICLKMKVNETFVSPKLF